ncbi:hypothetical protein [Amphritea balenae]|uniref:Uncharacterized protein n=1 Tax=Amphritea balenae TaxID=452629 RepID=A0A3P1SMF5_9GAMM|nr:hypothetical protein [Amphritea balenae]RRC98326.1 hypothetical protein EHS89_14655 [Amphritea balenae]GGK80983.1 hypothetical protein GCM10007941_34250 [Amphritea balenae]
MTDEVTELRKDLDSLSYDYKSDRKAVVLSFSVFAAASLAFFGFTYSKLGSIVDKELDAAAKQRVEAAIKAIEEKNIEAEEILIKIRKEFGEKGVTRRRSVLTFTHPKNGYAAGEEWEKRYYHIKTPVKKNSTDMWRYDLKGYSYGLSKPISLTWVGYTFSEPPDIRNAYAGDNTDHGIPASQYFGRDDFLYLRFGPIPQYYNSFVLDYQSGSTGEMIEYHDGYDVILTENSIEIK